MHVDKPWFARDLDKTGPAFQTARQFPGAIADDRWLVGPQTAGAVGRNADFWGLAGEHGGSRSLWVTPLSQPVAPNCSKRL